MNETANSMTPVPMATASAVSPKAIADRRPSARASRTPSRISENLIEPTR